MQKSMQACFAVPHSRKVKENECRNPKLTIERIQTQEVLTNF